METEFWNRRLSEIHSHIMLDCASGEYEWNRKGLIVADDENGEVLDFVKNSLKYDELKKAGKVNEITVDESWPFDNANNCWRKFVFAAMNTPTAKHGLTVINVSDIRLFGHCWSLKQLSKQETSEHIFDGYVLIVINGISWNEISDYAKDNNPGEFDAMMDCFYMRIL